MRFISCLILVLACPLAAQTVYRTVENGVVTFSDTPPEDGEAEIIELPEPPPADDGLLEERLAAMRKTTDRMAADRREREQHRAELRAAQAQQRATPAQSAAEPATGTVVGSYWPPRYGFWRPGRPPHRPPLRPTPSPLPAPAPPPGWSVLQPGNAQLMRPIVSSRR